jgi:hypothetical protein
VNYGQGAAAKTVAITGTNFTGTPSVTVSGAGVTVANVVRSSSTSLTAKVTVTSTAAIGPRDVSVSNADGGADTLTAGLTVTPGPTVSGIVPSSRGQGATAAVLTISGTGFQPSAAVGFSGAPGDIAVTDTDVLPTQISVTVDISGSAAVGARDVTVTNPDGGSATDVGGFAVGNGPTITTVEPATIGQGASGREMVITGAGFAGTPTVTFSASGLTATQVTRDSATQLTVSVDASSGAPVGASDVTITNPDAGTAKKANAVTVNAHPAVSSLSPHTFGRGFDGTVTVSGAAFQATPSLIVGGTGVVVANVVRVSPTELTATFTVASNAPLGDREVRAVNPDGGVSDACTACATIAAGPTVSSISPAAGSNTGTANITNLAGTGFASNATVALERTGQPDVPLENVAVNPAGTMITGTFDLSDSGGVPVAPGPWSVRVVNPTDGGQAVLANGFTVTGSAPSVTAVAPASAIQGSQPTLALTGGNFAHGATVTVSGGGVSVGAVVVNSASSVDAPINVDADAAVGARDVTVTNADGASGTCAGCLTITAAPSIVSISPSSFGQGASNIAATITGADFQTTPTVGVSGSGVTVSSVTRLDASTIQLRVDVDPAAATGDRDLTVTNQDGGTTTMPSALTVAPAPTVATVTPSTLGRGATNVGVTVTGSGFSGTPSVAFSGAGVTVASVTRDSATQLSLVVSVDPSAATDARSVTVTNPDGGVAMKASAMSVTDAPAVTSLAPSSFSRGKSNVYVTISGTGFAATPTITVSGSGVTVSSVSRASATQLNALVSVAAGAASGLRDVSVTNPDKGTSTAAGALRVRDRDLTFTNWTTVSSGVTSGTAVTSWGAGRLDVFYRGTDNALWHKWFANNVWSTESLGGVLTSAPAAASWSQGRLDVFVRGTDNGMWHTWSDGVWHGWESLGGDLTSAPGAASWSADRLDVFVRGTDNGMWHKWWDGGGWHGYESLGGVLTSTPAAASWGADRVDVVVRGTDNGLWHKWWDRTGWHGYEGMGGSFVDDVAVSSWGPNRLDVFAVAADHTLSWKTFTGTWSGYLSLPGTISSGPSAVSWGPNRVDVFAQGASQSLVWRTGTP